MKLRQAKAFGVFNHDNRRIRYVHADFDHGRRDQDLAVGVLRREPFHGGVFVGGFHLAVQERDFGAGRRCSVHKSVFRRREVAGLGALDKRADPIDFRAAPDRPGDAVGDFIQALEVDEPCVDGRAPGQLSSRRETSMSP